MRICIRKCVCTSKSGYLNFDVGPLMGAHVRVHVHVHVFLDVHVYAYACVCMCMYKCGHLCLSEYLCSHVLVYVSKCELVRIHNYNCFMCVYVGVYAYLFKIFSEFEGVVASSTRMYLCKRVYLYMCMYIYEYTHRCITCHCTCTLIEHRWKTDTNI